MSPSTLTKRENSELPGICRINAFEMGHLEIKRINDLILRNIDDPGFRERISPAHSEKVTINSFNKALDMLLNADVRLSRDERLRLFYKTLEYYSNPTEVAKPLWHSTSSYTLRKALYDGLSGGHGIFAGEAAAKYGGTQAPQGLAVTHPEYPSAESFQQFFARLNVRRRELEDFLQIDSEKITGKPLAQVFVEELLETISKGELRNLVAKRMKLPPESVDEKVIEQAVGVEAQKKFIGESVGKQYIPDIERIQREVLSHITDQKLRNELEYEAKHPFPCILTLEAAGKEEHLTTVSRGERPTHIPFEDRFWGTFFGGDIREIRIPQNQISKVRRWLQGKNLEDIQLIPLELYEIKRLIQEKT